VTGALKSLAGRGLVSHARYGHATLTGEGERIALDVERRHLSIQGFLTDVLGIDGSQAEVTACRLEHVLEPEVLARFVAYAEQVRRADPASANGGPSGEPL
jgi:DtxR family transcriptional regulator, Mn-dependent transcriptional regulator